MTSLPDVTGQPPGPTGRLAALPADASPIMSDQEAQEVAERWRKGILEQPRHNRLVLLAPLPRRSRLKLAIHNAVTSAGTRLGDHVSWTVTHWLWRATGLLGRKRRWH